MNQELKQEFEQLVQAYNQLPEAWTRRFEKVEGISENSLILRHRAIPLNIELSPLPGVPISCIPGCNDPEHITYSPVAGFQASLYAPLEDIASPEEGIEALRTLQERAKTIHLNLPFFGQEQITFGHYDDGVEYIYNVPKIRLERPLFFFPEHNLPRLIRTFSFIPYNFNLDVNAEPQYHPGTEEFRRQAEEYLQGYEAQNPTARIMGTSSTWLSFWSEDEETLRATSRDLKAIAESVQSRLQCRSPFRVTSTINPRNSKS